jgi:hypothetical protein
MFIENWGGWTAIIAFAVTFSIFSWFLVRAIRMKKDEADHMAALPLGDDSGKR